MEFWNKLSEALERAGFSNIKIRNQIGKLQETFGENVPIERLTVASDELSSALIGSREERQQKLDVVLSVAKEMQAAPGRELPLQPQRSDNRASFTIRLIESDAPRKPPVQHFATNIELLNEDNKPVGQLFQGRSDANGAVSFTVAYTEGQTATQNLKLTVRGLEGQELLEQTIKLDPNKPDISVEMKLATYRKRLTGPLDEWQQAMGRPVSTRLNNLFTLEKIVSLADIRKSAEKLKKANGLSKQETTLLNDLIAHAYLQVLSQDEALRQELIDSGFKDIFSIAAVSRADFLRKTKDQSLLSREILANQAHSRAVNQVESLKNRLLEQKIVLANGFSQAQTSAEPQPCTCDCQSAVSPLAYLADLLDFVLREVAYDDGELTLHQLEQFFYQLLSALPADCSASEEIVRQVRICIEVLRSKALADGKTDQADAAAAEHATRAYETLLSALGTSSRELRSLLGAPEADRLRRAQTLGISVEHLNDLRLTPTETALENIFGLQGTSRDPLSFGVKTGDNSRRIRRWQLQGVTWQKNTSEDGKIYGSLQRQSNKFIVTLFRGSSRTAQEQIARGEANRSISPVEPSKLALQADNGSGLTGQFLIERAANGIIDFELHVVPQLLIWQFRELNDRWVNEDHPAAVYPANIPLVDPDMLTRAYFCRPLAQNLAYGLWKMRATALSAEAERISAGSNDPSHSFRAMYDLVWDGSSSELLPPTWDDIASLLQSKEEDEIKSGVELVTALHLTVEAFNFLNELRLREIADSGNPVPERTETEIEERANQLTMAVDILVNVVKRRDLYPTWASEEKPDASGTTISLTQEFFCLPAVPVTHERPLRVSQEQYTQWQQQLAHNSRMPIVDPDIWRPLPHIGLSSGPVESLRHDRQTHLKAVHTQLDNVLGSLSSDDKKDWLNARLGTANLQDGTGGNVLHGLGFEQLDELQQAFANRQLEIRPQQHGLLPREVIALFTLRNLVINDLADKNDWQNIFHILIQAEKRRYLYPAWRKEEEELKLTLSPEFFRSPDQPLLLLLAGDNRAPEEIEWRGDAAALREIQGQLNARYQQRAALSEGLRAVVDSAEEATLPALRDALIDVLHNDSTGSNREQNKRDAANALLINTFESGCRKTTRVAQAIETMQLLVWGILNRQIEDRKFTIPAENQEVFQAGWHWLQSYATWRSAIFVYLYPENILLPALYQSDSVVFDVVRRIISGELRPVADDETGEENTTNYLSAKEDAVVKRVFELIGKKNPTSPDGIRQILYRMLYLRHLDDSASYSYSGDKSNPYFFLTDTDFIANQHLRFIIAVKPEDYFSQDTVLVAPGYNVPDESAPVFLLHQWNSLDYELEDMYLLPLHGAIILQHQGQFKAALEMYRWVYDFQKMDFRFDRVKELLAARQGSISAYEDWLYQDRLDPHALAKTRTDTDVDLRFILISIVRCLLEYAEAEFSADTPESLGRARELYFTAQRLLEHDALKQNLPDCEGSIGQLIREIGEKRKEVDIAPDIPEYDPYREALDEVLRLRDTFQYRVDPDTLLVIRDGIFRVVSQYSPGTAPRPAPDQIRAEVRTLIGTHIPATPTPDLETRFAGMSVNQSAILHDTLQDDKVFTFTQSLPFEPQGASIRATGGNVLYSTSMLRGRSASYLKYSLSIKIPGIFFAFCIPPNPLLMGLRLRAEIGLYKLSNCMNIAGMRRDVPLYAAPTDTSSGLPTSGNSGALTLPGTVRLQSTQYRYKVLVERARQLVDIAQQLESSYLSFLDKFDQETYNILRARHDLGISNAQVTLQGLRLTEALNGIDLAEQQRDRIGDVQLDYYKGLLESGVLQKTPLKDFPGIIQGLSEYEVAGLTLMGTSGGLQTLAAAGYFLAAGPAGLMSALGAIEIAGGVGASLTGAGAPAGLVTMGKGAVLLLAASVAAAPLMLGGVQATAGAASTFGALSLQLASFERRVKEWEFQRDLAQRDFNIAEVQITLAKNRHDIVRQEQTIAQLSADNAADVLHFLNNKFTSAELYNWMSGVVGEAYRYFLEQATAMAKMAQMQLAFERQETGLDHILNDYWLVTSTVASGGAGSDRRGLTGSVRLLQDLTRLDQHAFTTDKRKLQLSKTISLAMHDPVAFQLFKMTGVLPFNTTGRSQAERKWIHELFDRDFPGHYLRLIKRVRTTVIALVPPTQGIKATLSHTGFSHAVVSREGGALFENQEVNRKSESVALTSPTNDSGVFEMQEQSDMLLPFEGLGVAGSWEFRMPHAANAFNFGTIADVLVTIEYTALDGPTTFRQEVIDELDRSVSADRPFSFRHQFADAWYDLHHPEPQKPMAVSFTTRREDFPPNVFDLKIEYVTLYLALKPEVTQPKIDLNLRFTEQGKMIPLDGASVVDGIGIAKWTTAMTNAESLVGSWTLTFTNDNDNDEQIRNLFANDQIEDILFVITFGGRTPEWPE